MSKKIGIQPDEKDGAIQEIKVAMKANKDLRMHERYQTILMVLLGESYERIAQVTGRAFNAIQL